MSNRVFNTINQKCIRYSKLPVILLNVIIFVEKHIEGIWHTAIVVFGKEHFFGSNGISVCDPVSILINIGR